MKRMWSDLQVNYFMIHLLIVRAR